MAVNFCSNCGKKLAEGARFCIYCGTPVDSTTPDEPFRSAAKQPSSAMHPGMGLRVPQIMKEPEAQPEDSAYRTVSFSVLNWLVGASFMNALQNTEFLLLEAQENSFRWVPLSLITSLQGWKVKASASVSYYMDEGFRQISLPNWAGGDVIEGVPDAYLAAEEKSNLHITIITGFQPNLYGDLGPAITGRWGTCMGSSQRFDIRAIMALPFSGLTIKKRLQEHAAFIEKVIAAVKSPSAEQTLNEIIANMRAAEKRFPDTFADHIYCVAYVMENKKWVHTVLKEDHVPPLETVAAAGATRRITQIPGSLRTLTPQLETARGMVAARSPGIPLMRGIKSFGD